jgi:hypothetical protein
MREPNDLIGFGPVRASADKWRELFIGLVVLILLILVAPYIPWG